MNKQNRLIETEHTNGCPKGGGWRDGSKNMKQNIDNNSVMSLTDGY